MMGRTVWVEHISDETGSVLVGESNSILVEEHLAHFPKEKQGLYHHSMPMCMSAFSHPLLNPFINLSCI